MRPYKSARIKYLKQESALSVSNLFHSFPKEGSSFKIKAITPGKTKANRFWIVLFASLSFVIAAQLIVSNALAAKGQELALLEKQTIEISRENSDLYEELSSKTSLTAIAKQAEGLGLGHTGTVEYVTLNQGYSALAQ